MFSLLTLFLSFSIFDSIWAQKVNVKTPMGTVTGFHVNYNNNGSNLYYGEADIFLGIPFAQPPIGSLRFQPPQPITSYSKGKLDASQYRSACPQPNNQTCPNQSEDCLYLNVFTPNVSSANKYPVMVWIHGGSFTTGCAQGYPYKVAVRNLVSRGVVVVVIQYRLNIPGFFTTNTAEFPANRGLLDQVEALKWVQQNIASFGGDPRLVTLFGQSAGSISISAHTYSPMSRGLFQQAIMESGAVFSSYEGSLGYQNLSTTRAEELCNISVDQFNTGDYGQLLSCMNSLTPAQWISFETANNFGWRMTRDNSFFPGLPQSLNSQRAKIPVIYGNMKDEWAAYWYGVMQSGVPFEAFNRSFVESYFDIVGTFYGNNLDLIWNLTVNAYLPKGTADNNSTAWWLASNNIFTATSFTQFIIKDINLQLANGNPNVYIYEQTYGSKIMQSELSDQVTQKLNGYRPVAHSAEIPFVWMQEGVWTPEIQRNRTDPFDYILADSYGTWWTNFAKFGKPTLDNSWKAAPGPDQLQHYRIDQRQKGGMTMVQGYRDVDAAVFQDQFISLFGDSPNR